MIASDFAITKPGGLTVSECLSLGLPMILVNPIPGQEERNCSVLLEYGAALSAQSLLHLEYKTGRLLNDEALLQRMSSAARQLSKPRAAQWIARTIFEDCRELDTPRTPHSSPQLEPKWESQPPVETQTPAARKSVTYMRIAWALALTFLMLSLLLAERIRSSRRW